MSDKIYRWLLRLYPSHFRKAYGDAAMQLFRDRCRDERGFFRRLRLSLDLLADIIGSLPQAYGHSYAEAARADLLAPHFDGLPSFQVLQSEPIPRGSVVFAVVLSFLALGAFAYVMEGPIAYRPAAVKGPVTPIEAVMKKLNHPLTADPDVFDSASNDIAGPVAPQDATNAMIHLFQTHNIVMLGESHGNRQEYEWLCQLVKTPAFADSVDDIVVEHGNALYQQTVDRYIAGEDIPSGQVQKAWRNMISSVPSVSPVYGSFYQAIREANLQHRGKHQIRLLMGGPPGDWDRINSPQNLAPYEAEREQWYAQVVKDQVLAKHRRALLIMGASHFLRGHAQLLQEELLLQQHQPIPQLDRSQIAPGYIEQELRAAGANTYLVVFGSNVIDGQGHTDKRFDSWPTPAIAPASGSWLEKLPAQPLLSCGHAPATPLTLGDEADAMLYVAPCADLTNVEVPRAELEGTPYGQEVARRAAIILALPRQQALR